MSKESLVHSNLLYALLSKFSKKFSSKKEKVEYSHLPPLERAVRILTDEPEINPIHKFGLYSDTIVNMILSSDPKFSIGVNGDWGTGKTTLMKAVQMKLTKQDKTLRYLFNWNVVLENDNDCLTLKNFFRQRFSLSDVEDLKIERPKGNMITINNIKGLNSASIVLNKEHTASLVVDGVRKSDELIARRDNNGLNIYAKNRILTIWFNAWRYEREDQYSLIALMKTIGYAMGEDDHYKKIKPILLRGLGIIGKDILRNLALRYVMTDKGIEELDSKLLPKMDLLSKVDKDTVYFEGLEMIEREMKDIMKTTKIVIFIDDLDRCSPKKALEVLESIKVFLDIEGFIYVIGLSEDKVVQLIEAAYKEVGIKGVEYLQKIIQLQMAIPPWDSDIGELIERTLKYKLDKEYSDVIVKNKDLIAMSLQSNPRQIKRFINRFIISHQNSIQADSRPDHDEFLVLEILKVIWPDFYNKIGDENFLKEVKNYLRKENRDRIKDLNTLMLRKDSKDKPLNDIEKILINLLPDSRLWDFLREAAKRRIIFALDEERVENLEKKVTAHRQASESVKDIPMKWNYRISGKIHDPSGSPIENIPINAFDKNTLLTPDDFLGSSITDTLGRFEITFSRKDFAKPVQLMEGEPDIYLTITDPNKQFSSVYDSLGVYNKGVDNEGNVVWKGRIINDVTNIDKYDITVHFIDTTTSGKYGVPQMDAK